MSLYNKTLGSYGEKIAVNFLKDKGYEIIEQNYHSHWGEIDIIAKKDEKLSFIEVKTRSHPGHGAPYESINYYKLKSLKRVISYYLLKSEYKRYKLNLGVISIVLNGQKIHQLHFFENLS